MKFWNIFLELCQNVGKAPNTVAKEIGISSGAITFWKNDQRRPTARMLEKISAYFGVSVDFLLGYETQIKNNDAISDIVIKLSQNEKFLNTVNLLYNASDEQLNAVESMLLAFK